MGRQSKDRARLFSKVPGYRTRKQTQFATAEIKIGNPGKKKKNSPGGHSNIGPDAQYWTREVSRITIL